MYQKKKLLHYGLLQSIGKVDPNSLPDSQVWMQGLGGQNLVGTGACVVIRQPRCDNRSLISESILQQAAYLHVHTYSF